MAQVPLSGALSDSTTGPLVSGTVYHVTGNISLGSGSTLTIQPGVVVKFEFDRLFTVNGSLLCNGAGPDSVIFTDIRDDTAGGDTNGDGSASTPVAGSWRGVQFNNGANASQVNGLTVRYGGRFITNFTLISCDASFTDCGSEFSSADGFNLSSNSFPTMTRCSATGCLGDAFRNVHIMALSGFSACTASGNNRDRLDVSNGTMPSSTTLSLTTDNLLAGGCHVGSSVTVPASSILRLGPGVAFKMGFDRTVTVNGELDCNGTAANPVYFTDERDDTVGGDSNGDGNASVPLAGWWRGVAMNPGSDASVLERTVVRYGGRFISGLELSNTAPTLRNCVVSDISMDGVDLNALSRPTIDGLTVADCVGTAIQAVDIRALPSFSGIQLSGNDFDRIQVTRGTIEAGESVMLRRSQTFMDTLYLTANVTVNAGGTLTVEQGLNFKMEFDRAWSINGLLLMNGTANNPITVTEIRDDSVGGDTNNDGSITVPLPGYWRGVWLRDTSDGSRLDFTNIRYGGRFISTLELSDAAVTLNRCRIESSSATGVDFNNNPEPCVVERIRVNHCSGAAIDNVRFERLQDIEFAAGIGNDQNTIRVTNGSMTQDATIEPNNQFNGSILIAASVTVPQGVALNLQPGVVLKMNFDRSVTVNGRLSVRASLEDPVIITDIRDDSVGGDTNGDGAASVPARGWWRGVDLRSTTDTSIVIGLEVRYGGRFIPNILCSSALAAMRECRSEYSSAAGFRFTAHAIPLERMIAYENLGDGFELQGGGFDARQLSSVNNGIFGVDVTAGYTGIIRDSILWDNTQGAVTGAGAGRIEYSNGVTALAGTDGNIDTDPLFVNQGNGNLRLTQSSPCINTGDPASPSDPDSTRADMGALFFNFCEPEVICTQPASFPPCFPQLSYTGFASLSSPQPFTLRLDDAPRNSFAIFFYGIGSPTLINGAFGDICVGGPFKRTPPVPSGGNPAEGPCSGTFLFDFNAYIQTGADPAIMAGSNVIGHLWYRYGAAPGNARFSDGIQIPVCP